MYTAWYKASEWIDLATASSIFFGLFFTGVVVWVLIDRRGTFEAVSRLPLQDDDGLSPHQPSASSERQS